MSERNNSAIILPFYKQHTLISHNNLSCLVDTVVGAYDLTNSDYKIKLKIIF